MKKQNNQKPVELRGEVRAADLDGGQFSLRLDDGTKIVTQFTAEQEPLYGLLRSGQIVLRRIDGRNDMPKPNLN